jgi:hypothetical protein
MVRSYPRNNFLDILRDPLTVTMMASIALHAAIGALLLPMITRAQPEGKKAEPGTVKVVELTPNELQRIPQVPTPTPAQITLPPVYQPSPPVAPTIPKYSTTIPTSPIRTPTPTPTKSPKGNKNPPEKKSAAPTVDFNPEIFTNPSPSPKPSKSPAKKGEISKPSPQPTPSIKPLRPNKKTTTKAVISPKPSPDINTDDDGGGEQPSNSAPAKQPTKTSQNPTTTPTTQPSGSPNPAPSGSQPAPTGGKGGDDYYGDLADQVTEQLKKYKEKYKGIVDIKLARKVISYPDNFPCSNIKKTPYIIYTPVFGPVPQNQDPNLGSTTAEVEDGKVFTYKESGTEELSILATRKATEEAVKAESNRSEDNKSKFVVYSIRVEFEPPANCKK